MYNYNLQIKADSLQQQLDSILAQKKLVEEQMNQQTPIVQNNFLPSQMPLYSFYGEYCDDIYNIKNIDEKVIYMDKDEPRFMMKGKFYKFEEFEPKSEMQLLKEENERLRKEIEKANESSISKQESSAPNSTIPLEI